MAKLFATVMAFVFGITFGGFGVVQAKDMSADQAPAVVAEGKAKDDHGKAGEDQGKAGEDQGKSVEKVKKKGHAKKKKAS